METEKACSAQVNVVETHKVEMAEFEKTHKKRLVQERARLE